MELSDDEVSDLDVSDTDELLQEAFAAGKLKPGIVKLTPGGERGEVSESSHDEPIINNEAVLLSKLNEIKLPKTLNWVERLDITNDEAPLAPEIALQLDSHREKRERDIKVLNSKKSKKKFGTPALKAIEEDPIHNDFKREMSFYRQGQQAILKCLPRLKEAKIPTKRPDDYFAEMAKSDTHMQKIASVLLKKQTAAEKSEKGRKIREQKKIAKQTQVLALQEKHKAKKELMNSVKNFRKGQKNALDFLDDAKPSKKSKGPQGGDRLSDDEDERPKPKPVGGKGSVNWKRVAKDERYGLGGKKRGMKRNTKDSIDDIDDAGTPSRGHRGRSGFSRGGGGSRGGSPGGGRGGRGGFGGGRGGRGFSGGRGGRGGFGGGRGGRRGFSGGRGGREVGSGGGGRGRGGREGGFGGGGRGRGGREGGFGGGGRGRGGREGGFGGGGRGRGGREGGFGGGGRGRGGGFGGGDRGGRGDFRGKSGGRGGGRGGPGRGRGGGVRGRR